MYKSFNKIRLIITSNFGSDFFLKYYSFWINKFGSKRLHTISEVKSTSKDRNLETVSQGHSRGVEGTAKKARYAYFDQHPSKLSLDVLP